MWERFSLSLHFYLICFSTFNYPFCIVFFLLSFRPLLFSSPLFSSRFPLSSSIRFSLSSFLSLSLTPSAWRYAFVSLCPCLPSVSVFFSVCLFVQWLQVYSVASMNVMGLMEAFEEMGFKFKEAGGGAVIDPEIYMDALRIAFRVR